MKTTALKFLVTLVVVGHASAAWSYKGSCSGEYSCGTERVTGLDNRVVPRVVQPIGRAQPSPCGGVIPAEEAYQISGIGVTCGEGAVVKNRLPTKVKKEVMDEWDQMSRSSIADAQNQMQRIRSENLSWTGRIEFPMWESWNYTYIASGFNESRCGSEPWSTTCEMDWVQEEEYTDEREVTDYSNCEEYAPEPAPSSPSTGYSGPTGSYSGGDSYSRPSTSDYGSGSNSWEDNSRRQSDSASERNPDSVDRRPNSQCLRYGKKTESFTATRRVGSGTYRYSCMKTRPRYCQWPATQTVTRNCKNHTATYRVAYTKDPKFKPGYVDAKNRARDYVDIIPNKFDLLPGESEKIYTYANTGVSSVLSPKLVIDSQWNEYSYKVSARDHICRYNMKPQIQYNVSTLGRVKRKAPNVLALPRAADGKAMDPFANGFANLPVKPTKIELQDHARATMLAASQLSRTFPRPEGALARDKNRGVIYKTAAADPQMVTSGLDMGFWVDTQFKLQMFRKDKWGRNVRMTPVTKLNSNQVDTFDNYLTIHLNEQMPDKFYKGTGPFEGLFGWAWSSFGVELSPGRDYIIRIQTVQRGLPFYESGCPKNDDTCEGQEAKNKAFSAPIDIKFRADESVKRSFWRKVKDWHEAFVIF